ncbi:MAG: arginine repressor [Ruminococcaceae bacterium]|jgi:transcriptional regulator of arginine metabolism|nr:arginine repressor [Oscillospiraceae bacterium]
MKNERQELILSIIAGEAIETQEQLIERLRARGVKSTQATISRDIKQLHIVKESSGDGRYRYAASAQKKLQGLAERLQVILRQSITGVDFAQNIVVLKTMPGLANAAGAAFDGMEDPRIVGSIAGDDTLMIVMRNTEDAKDLCEQIAAMQ